MTDRMPNFFLACCVLMSMVGRCQADFIIDDFENQEVGSGPGFPLGYFSFGEQLSDRGVTNLHGATSGSKAAVYAINFNVNDSFGVGAAHENLNLILSADNLVAVNLKFVSGLQNGGFVAFRLEDADGTIVRTADANLFSASANFQTLSQTVSEISSVDKTGNTAGLDLTQITSVGLLFFDRSFSGTSTVLFDDLRIIAVPEPNSFMLVSAAVLIGILRRRKKHVHERNPTSWPPPIVKTSTAV